MRNRPGMPPEISSPVDEWFDLAGRLARAVPGFEPRASQHALARDIHQALVDGGALVGEAPTGVGKSLAYLVPALLWSERNGEPVVISTYTKSLQDQLLRQDVPLLERASGRLARVVVLKGKSNYLCGRRYRALVAEDRPGRGRPTSLESDFGDWAAATETGDLDEFPWQRYPGGPALRGGVAADAGFCGAGVCRISGDCAFRRARREAAAAQLVIVNHALLVSGQAAGGVLPPFRALIVDEAQHLESSVTSQLTTRVTPGRFERAIEGWARGRRSGAAGAFDLEGELFTSRDPAGEAAAEAARRLRALGPGLLAACRRFFLQVALPQKAASAYAPRRRFHSLEDLVAGKPESLEEIFTLGREAEGALEALSQAVGRLEPSPDVDEMAADVGAAMEEWRALVADLDRLADPRGRERVHWCAGAEAASAELAAAPVSVAAAVREWLLAELSSLVLVSATLRVGEDFSYVLSRLGLDEEPTLAVRSTTYPSPFDWPSQVRALTHSGGQPTAESVAEIVLRLRHFSDRNILVLFTSHAALRRARSWLAERLPPSSTLWAQDVDGDAARLAERFRETRGAVLLGTSSFWEGVDFPGEALEILVLAKLPFAVPDEPLIEARCERVEEEGGSGFRDVLLPDAVLRFRQGIGRLVRRATDRGVVVIADARAVTRSYGGVFRRALPVPLEVTASPEALARMAADFFGGEARAAVESLEPADAIFEGAPGDEP